MIRKEEGREVLGSMNWLNGFMGLRLRYNVDCDYTEENCNTYIYPNLLIVKIFFHHPVSPSFLDRYEAG